MQYRREIDGVRAVAVCAVILYHAGVPAFAGGYLGVDVFFVISGYLITGLLTDALASGSLSIFGFYERRFRRIIPALIVMMALCTPLALLVMLPDDLENFGQSLTATAFFANNILLLLTSGYFELETAFKPLMHTWSLGVEEQYYLVAPVVLYAAFRMGGKRGCVWAISLIAAASFAFSIWASSRMPVANFFLLPARAWELGAGALAILLQGRLCAFAPRGTSRAAVLAFAGAVLTGAALLGAFPASSVIAASFASLGTTLVLVYAEAVSGPGRVLASRPFVAVGLISYSAYLYHQPVFAFARIARFEPPSTGLMVALIPLVFALAWVSWRYVEQPFRDRHRVSFSPIATLFGFGTAGLAAIGLVLHMTSGFYSRWPELDAFGGELGARQNIAFNYRPLTYREHVFSGDPKSVKVLVVGDSFARDFINMALESHNDVGLEFSYWEFAACSDTGFAADLDTDFAKADFVILAENGPLDCLLHKLAAIRSRAHGQVAVIGTKNFGWNLNAVRLLPSQVRYAARVSPLPETQALNAACAAAVGAASYVDVMGILGDADGQLPIFTPEHKFISEDRSHLTRAGAAYVGRIMFESHPVLSEMAKAGRRRFST